MAAIIYTLCTVTSLTCAALLFRGFQRSRQRLLLWSGLCFAGLTVNNLLLVLDRLVFTEMDLSTPRLAAAFAGVLLLLVGLIFEGD